MNRKIFFLSLVILVLFTTPCWALNSPGVVENHGVFTGLITSDAGLSLGAEYGLTSELAIMGEVGGPATRIGGKYQVDPALALLAGITEDSPFLGINGAHTIDSDITGVYEFNISTRHDELSLLYKLGGILKIDQAIDLRAGLVGQLEDSTFPDLQLGLGYKF